MADVISEADLASWLRDETLEANASIEQIVELVNELVSEEWTDPSEPVPARIKLLALGVGARAWVRNPSTAHLESVTRSIDDGSRTERYRSSGVEGSVYLTDAEVAILRGEAVPRSLRLTIYGQS